MKLTLILFLFLGFTANPTETISTDDSILEEDATCRIRVLHIFCEETEDWGGTDEIYLDINGTETDIFYMSAGDSRNLSNLAPVKCYGTGKIKCYDYDDGKSSFIDPDDHLGTRTVYCEETGKQTAYFTLDGANYKLEYEVFK